MFSIALHELGHLIPAKLFGIKVTQYFVGFGKTLWSKKIGETEYGIKAIPLGGYCRIVGMYPQKDALKQQKSRLKVLAKLADEARQIEQEEVSEADQGRLFYQKPLWQRLIVMAGGVAMNIVLGMVIFYGVNFFHGQYQPTTTVDYVAACITTNEAGCSSADPKSPASLVDLRPGDTIVSVNQHRVDSWSQVRAAIAEANAANQPIVFSVDRAGAVIELAPANPVDSKIGFGVKQRRVSVGIGQTSSEVATQVVESCKALVKLPVKTVQALTDWLSGAERDVSGPISVLGAGVAAGEIASQSSISLSDKLATWLLMLGSINLFVGILNIVPLPPLDGGHAASACYGSAKRWLARRFGLSDPGPFDTAKLLPVSWVVGGLLALMGVVLILVDIFNPVKLF